MVRVLFSFQGVLQNCADSTESPPTRPLCRSRGCVSFCCEGCDARGLKDPCVEQLPASPRPPWTCSVAQNPSLHWSRPVHRRRPLTFCSLAFVQHQISNCATSGGSCLIYDFLVGVWSTIFSPFLKYQWKELSLKFDCACLENQMG